MKGDAAFVLYCSVDIPAQHVEQILYRPGPMGIEPYVPQLGQDQEICQFSVEMPSKPMKEKHFKAAFEKMALAAMEKARSAGLVIP